MLHVQYVSHVARAIRFSCCTCNTCIMLHVQYVSRVARAIRFSCCTCNTCIILHLPVDGVHFNTPGTVPVCSEGGNLTSVISDNYQRVTGVVHKVDVLRDPVYTQT